MSFFKTIWRIFKVKPPVVGQIFEFDETPEFNPFKEEKPFRVEVLEVKDGWVRYRFCDSTMWQDNTLPFRRFLFCYRPIE